MPPSHSIAQTYIDIDTPVNVLFDGQDAKTVQLEASLLYGFAYRVPLKIAVSEGVDVSSLHGSTICNCVSFTIKNGHVKKPDAPGRGFLLIKPKSEDLYQVIDIMGTRAGEVDPVLIAKIKLACEVFQPLRVTPAIIEVKERRLMTTEIQVEPTDEVTILETQIADTSSQLNFNFDTKTQIVSVIDRELPEGAETGQIALRFNLLFRGQKKQYESIVAYEPKKPLRLIPKMLTFRDIENKFEARFVITGFSLSQNEAPRFVLEQEKEPSNWALIDADVQIDTFGFGKAVGKLLVKREFIDFQKEPTLRFRLRSEDKSLVLDDIRAVLVR